MFFWKFSSKGKRGERERKGKGKEGEETEWNGREDREPSLESEADGGAERGGAGEADERSKIEV